jgi:NAD(P)-dependent dehydrogenase (short-subunit alcohol dehydrogenase family)
VADIKTNGTGRLDGKVAIVTGAGTGIGEAIAHKFAHEGASVLAVGLPDDPVDDVVAAIRRHGGKAEICIADVADEKQAEAAVACAIETFGKLDILINRKSPTCSPSSLPMKRAT